MKYIKQIEMAPNGSARTVTIRADQRNLIITGKNGAGKTTLLKKIYMELTNKLTTGDFTSEINIAERIKEYDTIQITPETHGDYYYQIMGQRELLEQLIKNNPFKFDSVDRFEENFQKQLAVVEYFSAERQANITVAASASNASLSQNHQPRIPLENSLENTLEQHIANLYVRKAIALTFQKNKNTAIEIDLWLSQFERDLQYLTEDESTQIEFDPYDFKVYIKQRDKDKYSLQSISSGYSSILAIFSRLLMRAAYLHVTPDKIEGVAIIDEIDVHLHVSLQKKVLPFLANSFPNIQFIVSTHSPFILTSTDDAVIFDLTSLDHAENVSAYSYESILEGLFGVHSASDKLQSQIRELSKLTNKAILDGPRLASIVKELTPDAKYLDFESRFFFNKAVLRLTHNKDD